MMKLSIAFLAAMSLAAFGCHKDKAKGGESIAKLTELKSKMCACKDKTCSEKISAELAAWDLEQDKADGDKPGSPSGGAAEKIDSVKDEISQCLLKLELPGRAAGAAGGPGGTMGSGSPAAGAAGGSGGTMGSGSPAAGAAGGSSAAGAGSSAAGSAH